MGSDSKLLLGEYLDDVWGKGFTPRNICLAYKPNPADWDVKSVPWPEKRSNVIEFILSASARGMNVYYNPATFNPNVTSNTQDGVYVSKVLWCDFDGNADEARAKLAATPGLPAPSWVLQTGLTGHEHWYWVLSAPAAPQDFEPVNKKLAYYLDADTGCWNSNRVMRPPYTTNYMDAKKYQDQHLEPQPVDFIEKNDTQYKLADFSTIPDVKDSIMEKTKELGDIPNIGDVLAKYEWDERHLDLFKNPSMSDRSGGMVRLAYFGAEVGMSDEEIYAVIDNVDRRVKKFLYRKDRERRLAQIIAKVRAKYPYGNVAEFRETDEPIQQVMNLNELLRSKLSIEWLVDKLFVARTINFLSAESGIGKSRLAMQLGLAMATGTQFLKWPITRQMKVMYISLEMYWDMCKHFVSDMTDGKEIEDALADNFLFFAPGKPIDISKEEAFSFLGGILEQHKPEFVIIDAMGKLTFDEIGETQAKTINNQLNRLIQQHSTTFLIIHHNRKPDLSGKKRPGLGDVYGNQYVVTDAATVLTMFMPDNQAHVELIFAKSRAMATDDYLVMNGKGHFKFRIKEKEDYEEYEPNRNFDFS